MTNKNSTGGGGLLTIGAFAFFSGILILFLANNFTTPGIYEAVSCTFNHHSCNDTIDVCDVPGWDGQCTSEIKNECCDPIRMCAGQIVDNYEDCLDQYCYEEDKYCDAIIQIQGGYKCTCMDIWEMPQ